MAYERLNLRNGQVLRAEHLVHLENGLAAANAVASDMVERIVGLLDGTEVSGEDVLTAISDAVGSALDIAADIEERYSITEADIEEAINSVFGSN